MWGIDAEIMYANFTTATGWSNVTVISDGYDGTYWNDDISTRPAITVDNSDRVHVVWYDDTDGVWGTDIEIMYTNFTTATGWSNVTVISDGYDGTYWNDGHSYRPAITVDNSDRVHVVWHDYTDGVWGTGIDTEIMYANFTTATGWSNVTIISDGYDGTYWNDGGSYYPAITVDSSDRVHVVWYDKTDGAWGIDQEIMYANFTTVTGWSNVTVISDGYDGTYWNDGESLRPAITVDSSDRVHVVWHDYTEGVWGGGGTDPEIMYVNFAMPSPPLNPSIIINNGDASTNSTLVTLTLSADGAEEMCFRNGTTGAWTSWEPYSTAKQLYLEGYVNNTEYSIYVKFRNAIGETSPIGDSILYLTIPLNPSIIINNGDASTNSTLVTLTLSADEAEEMCFRNGTTGAWTSWEPYATAKQLYLEGSVNNTEYSICVKFRNAAGETTPVCDSILYTLEKDVEEGLPVEIIVVIIVVIGGLVVSITIILLIRKRRS